MASFGAAFGFPLGGDPETVATIALPVEGGARLTYSWKTDILTSWGGLEQRIALLKLPRRKFEFTSLMSDEQARATFANLAANMASAPAFLLALAYEDLTITDVDGADVTVTTLDYTDWHHQGQRVVVVNRAGEFDDGIVNSSFGSILTLASAVTTAEIGGRVMPGLVVYLEDTQQLSHHRVNVSRWNLTAIAADFRFGDSEILPGTDTVLTTFDSLNVWDRGVQSAEATRSIVTGTDMIDLGFAARPTTAWTYPAWGRSIRIESNRRIEWQWLKRFLHTIRGRQKAFLLPSSHPDLVAIGDASTGTLVVDAAAGYVDSWFPSLAHRRLAIVLASDVVAYRQVTAAIDNGDGTHSLTLSSALAGDIVRVEFLELVRLESDDVTVTWSGNGFVCELMARVVQQ